MSIATTNPATGELVKTFQPHSTAEVDTRIRRAHDAFATWRRAPLSERVKVIARAAQLLDERKDEYGRLMTLEMGKLFTAAREEAAKCALGCRYYAQNAATILANEQIRAEGEESYVAYHPLGVVLAVMPWNFPFWQVIRFAAPALVAGNVGLLKHASNVPQCAVALEKLFIDAGAPAGVFQSLLIGSDAVGGMIDDERVAAVTLTGSEGAGSQVAERAGRHIKKTVLELGGSDPFIVMPSADLMQAVETAVKARTINNGQSCIAAKRFIVHEGVYAQFEKLYAQKLDSLTLGDPMDAKTQVGPLASKQVLEDLERQVAESARAGAKVVTGGKRLDRRGFYFQPTLLTNIPAESPAYKDELFGPVAALFRARDAGDALRIANDSTFGLGSSVWTTDAKEAVYFARELEAGTVFVNGMVASDPRFPFGGVKKSGYGRELSAQGLREFVNVKTVRMFGIGTSATQGHVSLSE